MITKGLVNDIAERLSASAYMSYAFPVGAYRQMIKFLDGQGFTPSEIEALLDSKHVRWSRDADDRNRGNSKVFIRYFERKEAEIREDVKRYEAEGHVAYYRGRQWLYWHTVRTAS